jgi:hypothetical protein
MKKQFIVYALLCLCFRVASAQTVEWSNQQKTKNKTFYTQILGENSSGIFIARTRNSDFRSEIVIEKYKANLSQELGKDLPQPENSQVERVIVTETGLMQFVLVKNANTQKIELQLIEFDNTLNQISAKTLFALDGKLAADRKLYIKPSADRKLYTLFFVSPSNDNSRSVINVYGYDASFILKYNRKFGLNSPMEQVDLKNLECDNQGNVFALLNLPRQEKKSMQRGINYFLYSYFPATDNMLEYEIGTDSVFINEISMVVNNYANTLNIAGFYSDKADKRCIGTIYYRFDVKGAEMAIKRLDPIDLSFSSKIAGTMMNERSPKLTDLYIRKLVANSDGGCTIIAEKYYETKQSYTYTVNGFPQTNFRTIYNYDEIVVIAKNADGTNRFKDFIKKNQTSMTDGGYYSSFVTLLANDKIGLVYNLDVVNEGDVMLTTISSKGLFENKVLIKSMSYYATIMPLESKQVSGNSAIICTLKDRRFCLMRVTF